MTDTVPTSTDRMAEQVERASYLFDLGRAQDAERRLRAVLAADPMHFQAASLLSWLLYQTDRDEEAYEVGKRLIASAPDHPRGHLRAGWALYSLGRVHEAEDHARQAVRLVPQEPDAHRLLAQVLGKIKGRGEEAIAAAEEALRLAPDDAAGYSAYAMVLIYAHRWDEAERAMAEALARRPLDTGYRMRMGIIHVQLRRFDAARDDFMAALRGDSSAKHLRSVVDTYLSNGSPAELAGLYRLACAALGTADLADGDTVSADPRILGFQADLVWSLYRGGQHARAYHLVRALLVVEPGHQEARSALADLLKADERYAEALPIAETLRAEGHGTVDVYKTLILSRYKLGRLSDALAAAREAERRHPDVPNFSNLAASFLIDLDRYPEAVDCARRVVVLDPDYDGGQRMLGKALRLAGRPEEAVPILQEACHQYPDDASAALELAMCLVEVARVDEAEAAARRAIALEPDSARAYTVLVHVLRGSPERTDDCRLACEQALTRDPDNHEILFALAVMHVGAERWQDAEPLAARAHALRPENGSYHMVCGFAHLFAGHADEARTELARYLDQHPSPDNFSHVAEVLEDIGVPEEFIPLYARACTGAHRRPIDREDPSAGDARAEFAGAVRARAADPAGPPARAAGR